MRSRKQTIFVVCVAVLLVAVGLAAMLVSTGGGGTNKIQVVTSFYPLGYMAEEIGGDKVQVTTLIPENTEVHSWSPSASDIATADKADLLFYNGAGLDAWVEEQLLTSIDASDTLVVRTTKGMDLSESSSEDTRFFVFDNDNSRTLVYDLSGDHMVLTETLPLVLNATANFSGYFDPAVEVTNSAGYVLLFIPNANNITVLNTGLHGDHFHDPEVVTVIEAGKPVHWCVSDDGKYVAFALDVDNAALVINVDAPAEYTIYPELGGTSASSHATVVFDENDLLYYADMREDNLMIVDVTEGTVVLSGGTNGGSPHGGVFSSVTGKVYLNCLDSIAVIDEEGYEKNITYSHEGGRFTRSWISDNGTWLVSYVGDTGLGLAYTKVIVYDLVTEAIVREIPVEVAQKGNYGWPASIHLGSTSQVAITDPQNGTVLLIDLVSGEVTEVELDVEVPVSMRLVEANTENDLWVVTGDGTMHLIDVQRGTVEETSEMETDLGENIVLAAVTTVSGDSSEVSYDPHTWISPYTARQQAKAMYEALVARDPGNSSYYAERWGDLDQRLVDLDEQYSEGLGNTSVGTIFVSHEAYGYLADRYGFEQEGVLGLSADGQPSTSALSAIVDHMLEDEVYVLFLDPVYTDNYITTLKANVESLSGHSVVVLMLYLMTGTVDGLDYLEQMEANFDALEEGLGAVG